MCAKYRRGNVLSVWALNRALAKQKREMGQKEACKSPTPGRHFADFKMVMVGGALASSTAAATMGEGVRVEVVRVVGFCRRFGGNYGVGGRPRSDAAIVRADLQRSMRQPGVVE